MAGQSHGERAESRKHGKAHAVLWVALSNQPFDLASSAGGRRARMAGTQDDFYMHMHTCAACAACAGTESQRDAAVQLQGGRGKG